LSDQNPNINKPVETKPGSLLRSSGLVGVMTMLSRLLGLARDIIIANFFGAGAGADAFFVAFKIPNFMRRLFAEGAFAQAFVPVLSEYRTTVAPPETRRLISSVAGSLGLVLLLITVVAVVFAPLLAGVFAPGFLDDGQKYDLTVEMLRITFPYLLLISMTAFAGAILNCYGNFAVPAFTPVLLNLSLIASVYFLTPYMDVPVVALAWGAMIAGFAQLLFQMPFLARMNLLPMPRLDMKHEGVKRIMRLMTPALFGVSVSQINLLLDTVLASFLVTGSVSWLYYSDRLSELPLGVFGIAIATAILPSLSRKHAAADSSQFSVTLDWALRSVLLIGLPAALALGVLAVPLIAGLFQNGALTDNDVLMSAQSLRAYAAGLLFFMLIKVLATGYFSRQDTKTPVKIGVVAMVANMAFNLILVVPLAHAGLALATSLSAILNAGLLWRGLRRQSIYLPQPGWGLFCLRLGAAALGMVLLLIWLTPSAEFWLQATVWSKVFWLAGICVAGAACYFAILILAGVRLSQFRMRD